MIPTLFFISMMFFASVFAFLKMFYKTSNYTYFVIIGIVFSVLEFFFRIPSVDIGFKTLGYPVIFLQILWVAMSFITSSILCTFIYGEIVSIQKIFGMLMILGGVYISSK
jgi:hypothetical protein